MDSRREGEVGLLEVGSCGLRSVISEVTVRPSARFSMKQSEPVETGRPLG